MNYKNILFLILFLCPSLVCGQSQIQNKDYFSNFLSSNEKDLLIVGENHSSSVGPKIYPELVEYLHENAGLNSLLIEFGPSEAYFYNLYLETGNEKWLRYTLNGLYYKDWVEAWRKVYAINKKTSNKLEVIGIDFDRTRTFGYALYNIFNDYEDPPIAVDSLMNVISDTTFYNTYTIGYPTEKGKKFVSNAEQILKNNYSAIKALLSPDDMKIIDQMLANTATGYGGNRETEIVKNTTRIIESSGESNFLLFIGRNHAYYHPIYGDQQPLADFLNQEKSFQILSGVILFENSQLLGKDYKEVVTLNEIANKKPWKEYHEKIDAQSAESKLTIVPLEDELLPLKKFTDYLIIARDQEPISVNSK